MPGRSDTVREDFLKIVESESERLFDSEPVWFTDNIFIAVMGRTQGELWLALWAHEPSCYCQVQVQKVKSSVKATPAIVHGQLEVRNHFASMRLPPEWAGHENSDLSVSVRVV